MAKDNAPEPPSRHGQAQRIEPHWVGKGDDTGFGRLFPKLPAFRPPSELLRSVAETMLDDEAEPQDPGWATDKGSSPGDNPAIPAGFTYFGQFIDHDITFDVGSRLDRHAVQLGHAPLNFRTPRLDLDSVYGPGPEPAPHLYDERGERIRLGEGADGDPDLLRLPQEPPGRTVAVLPEPRNDENVIVAQIHLAVAERHGGAVDETGDFEAARNEVRVRYHRAVVEDYLPTICGEEVVAEALRNGPALFPPPYGQFIPVEFAAAGFRFGHSQVRPRYQISPSSGSSFPVFRPDDNTDDLSGGRRLPATHRISDLGFWFGHDTPQKSRLIDRHLAPALFQLFGAGREAKLPPPSADIATKLAARNLERGVVLGLPSGEDVLDHLVERGIVAALPSDQRDGIRKDFWGGLSEEPGAEKTPLWGWVLSEAKQLREGHRLGPVGSAIVAHTLLGLLFADPRSRIRMAGWTPGGGGTVLGFLKGE